MKGVKKNKAQKWGGVVDIETSRWGIAFSVRSQSAECHWLERESESGEVRERTMWESSIAECSRVAESKWVCTEWSAEAKWARTGWGSRGQIGLQRMERQRPNGRAQKEVAEAKWACTEWSAEAKWACTEGGGRGQMGLHRMGWQRPNGLAQDGAAEAKWACTGWGGRSQMGLHRMEWQRPNGLAQNGAAEAKWACTGWSGRGQMGLHRMERQRPNGHAQDGVAEAKWACTEGSGRGQMGLHRMEQQRPNELAQNGTEITARDTELSPKPSLYIRFRTVIFRPRCGFRTYWSRCLEGINILGLGNTQCFKEIHSEKKWPFQVKGCTNGSP
ncbi:hypothetical protein B0H14DRAFT_2585466 [Mycena olivaceomarginata]|nr:hypothetical protein B0H14DRAFT_2585466 [Mycena olivaceomarginata]